MSNIRNEIYRKAVCDNRNGNRSTMATVVDRMLRKFLAPTLKTLWKIVGSYTISTCDMGARAVCGSRMRLAELPDIRRHTSAGVLAWRHSDQPSVAEWSRLWRHRQVRAFYARTWKSCVALPRNVERWPRECLQVKSITKTTHASTHRYLLASVLQPHEDREAIGIANTKKTVASDSVEVVFILNFIAPL